MKRILFLAPYCIPVNNPEAICNAKLLKILCEGGHQIDVISKNNKLAYTPDEEAWAVTICAQLSSVKTFYLDNRITFRTILDHIRIFLKTGYVYKGAHWAVYAIRHAERLIRGRHYDYILSRSPAAELAALYLSKKYHIKWIANWNDPYPDKKFPHPYGSGSRASLPWSERRLMQAVAIQAQMHTFANERLKNYMRSYMPFDDRRTRVVPHACLHDLIDLRPVEPHTTLQIVHSGNISWPRSPETLFMGLRQFLHEVPDAKIQLTFIGKEDAGFRSQIAAAGLDARIQIVSAKSYVENLRFIARFDLALLVEADLQEGIFLPTKVGDYMQCRLPIWSISPAKGVLNDLYERGEIAYFSDVASVQDIAATLRRIYERFNRCGGLMPRMDVMEDYTEAAILKSYETLFEFLDAVK